MLFLKQLLTLHFLCHKSATTCQIDSNKVSNSKLNLDLCNCINNEITESIAPPQQPHKRRTIFVTPCTVKASDMLVRMYLKDILSFKVTQSYI